MRRENSDDFSDIQILLRLKRHEQPDPGFGDRMVAEFHRRQSADLLNRPLWRLAFDRFQAWIGGDDPVPRRTLGTVGFAAATALILAGLLFGDRFLEMGAPRFGASSGAEIASIPRAIQLEATPVALGEAPRSAAATPSRSVQLLNPDVDFIYMLSSGQLERARVGAAADEHDAVSRAVAQRADSMPTAAHPLSTPRYILDSRLVSYEPTRF